MKHVVTIGGGVAGIEVSSLLSELGYKVTVIEKSNMIGGKILQYDHLFPDLKSSSEILKHVEKKCRSGNFEIRKNTTVDELVEHQGKYVLHTSSDQLIESDAVVIATGFDFFDATRKEEYGYGIYDNILTSVDLEALFRSGKPVVTKDGKVPKRAAFIHCVGSRDEKSGNQYCSKVCCITGVKQAMELNEKVPSMEIFCFYMDLRMYGQFYEETYKKAQERHHVQFIRGRVSEVAENIDGTLLIKAEDTLSGRPLKMILDLVILLVGMEAGKLTTQTAHLFGLQLDETGFIKTRDVHTQSNLSSKKGIFLAGACSCPMSINDTLENARSAAFEVHNYFKNG